MEAVLSFLANVKDEKIPVPTASSCKNGDNPAIGTFFPFNGTVLFASSGRMQAKSDRFSEKPE